MSHAQPETIQTPGSNRIEDESSGLLEKLLLTDDKEDENSTALLTLKKIDTEDLDADSADGKKKNRLSLLRRPRSDTYSSKMDLPNSSSPHYDAVVNMGNTITEIKAAIAKGKLPELVIAGSSGSYWVHDRKGKKLGIFKPKNEEPYGDANPKLAKRLHKTLLPCCFGRSCMLRNQGYVSEAAAFAVDVALDLQIVPPTRVLKLSAKSFNYSAIDKRRKELPAKIGSLQLFVQSNGNGKSINYAEIQSRGGTEFERFLDQFQRLVILDYIIRNTDRGADNWLTFSGPEGTKVHAIDNGLSFPFKHPDNWRTYPPSWASHALGKIPFKPALIKHVLSRLSHVDFMDKLADRLQEVMRMDDV